MKTSASAADSRHPSRTATKSPSFPRSRAGDSQACINGGDAREPRPIDFLPATCDRRDVAIAHQTREGHRRRDGLGGIEREPDVLQPVLELEARGLVSLFGDDLAVVLVDR